MNSPSQQEWEAAARRLYEDEYAFVATGPRDHEDWRTDVLAVLARTVPDPRGWAVLRWDEEEDAAPERGSAYPFTVSTEERLGEILHEVSPDSAAQLLVALVDEWFEVKNIPNFSGRREELLTDARTLLARYLPDAVCYTSAGRAEADPHADFFQEKTGGGFNATELMMDLGVVVVSPAEVGVFWRFNAY
ncbi:hypothetical protein [Streptomyces sp. enrichment culture]|uniref:hypothetical protein n=1 Tax=Streptomyces sp. enrichment culture TaxID=1795815 RepID=UPI003F57450D